MTEQPPAGGRRSRGLAVIAVYKLGKAVAVALFGVGALRLLHPGTAAALRRWLAPLTYGAEADLVRHVLRVLDELTRGRLELLGYGALAYAALFVAEGVGLWRERRWGEYLTVISTGIPLPFEAWALVRQVSAPRVIGFAVNVVVVVYLIVEIRRHVYRARPRGA